MNNNTNMTAVPVASGLLADKHRTYLCIFAEADVVVTLEGQTPFTIPTDTLWEPLKPPTNALTCTGTGTIITG
jgi:hypothetical protein